MGHGPGIERFAAGPPRIWSDHAQEREAGRRYRDRCRVEHRERGPRGKAEDEHERNTDLDPVELEGHERGAAHAAILPVLALAAARCPRTISSGVAGRPSDGAATRAKGAPSGPAKRPIASWPSSCSAGTGR